MKLLDNKEDLKKWFAFHKGYGAKDEDLPDRIREVVILNNGFVRPVNCDREVLKEIFVDVLTEIQPVFNPDIYCEPVIKTMINYYCGESELSFKKGLLLMGGIGSGKTLLMRGLNRFLKQFVNLYVSYVPGFNEIASYDLAAEFSRYGFEMFNDAILGCDLFIDDIGLNDSIVHYGNNYNITSMLLMRRYDSKYKTHGTTNLDAKALKSYFDERIYSRMKEMFNTIYLKGEDRRK